MGFSSPNYTQIPNEMLDDWLHKLGLAELKVLMVIMRKTFGWHKTRDRISLNQLKEITGLEKTHISKATKSLVEKNLISKTVEGKKGTQNTFYELVLIEDSNNLYGCRKDTGGGVVKTPTKETLTKEKESPIVPKRGPPPFSKKNQKKEKLEVAKNVFLTSEQQQSLLQRLDNNPDKLKACYEKLSVWKIAKVQTNINDYLNIIRWVIKAVEEDLSKPKPEDREALNAALVAKIQEKYPYLSDIVYGRNYIEFKFGPNNCPYIKFSDHGFEEQVMNNLRKLGLFI